jgi:transposase-like protein
MPWRESSVVEERLRFVVLASRRQSGPVALCREFGISRQTGYTWLERCRAGGASQVVDRSRQPLHSPGRTRPEVEQHIVALRQQWPEWGTIAVRTVHRILERYGLIQKSERHQIAGQRFERSTPTELWQMDFKGPQRFNKGSSVGPLSILDDHSRYLIALEQLGSTRMEGVQSTLQQAFEAVGVPEAVLMDHGTPWGNAASPWGITELTVWMMRQGVRLAYSGNPEDPQWLEEFRHEYNYMRPHEALALATPASRWRPSSRRYQPAPPEWVYPPTMEVVPLHGQGQLFWQRRRWEVSRALRRQRVGIEVIADRAIVYFCNTPSANSTCLPAPASDPG